MPTPTASRIRPARRLLALALGASLAVGASACGEDDAGALSTSVCDAFTTLSTLEAQAPYDPAELPGFVEDVALPAVRTIARGVPADLQPAGEVIDAAFTELASTGNFEAVLAPDVAAAKAEIGARLHRGCSGRSVTVGAQDYHYTGLPDRLPAGIVNLRLDIGGTEDHEMLVLRRNDGETADLAELIDQPEELMGKAAMVAVLYGEPGDVQYARLDLEAGTYFFLCLLPTDGDDTDPHLYHGMHRQVTVG